MHECHLVVDIRTDREHNVCQVPKTLHLQVFHFYRKRSSGPVRKTRLGIYLNAVSGQHTINLTDKKIYSFFAAKTLMI
jgi:hypothetical protein